LLQIGDEATKLRSLSLYRTKDGSLVSNLPKLDWNGKLDGLFSWCLLTSDGEFLVLFFKRKPDGEKIEVQGASYSLTNNLCVIHKVQTGETTSMYTSNQVIHVENADGELLFFSNHQSANGQKPLIFDRKGGIYEFPSFLPHKYQKVTWDFKNNRVIFASLLDLFGLAGKHSSFKVQFWFYDRGRVEEK
jgi:hypothetical protein